MQFTRPKQARRRPARQNKRQWQEEPAPPAQHAGGPRRPKQAPQQRPHGSSATSSAFSSSIGKQDYRREDLVRMADAEFQRKLRDARSIEDLWEVYNPCKCAVTSPPQVTCELGCRLQ